MRPTDLRRGTAVRVPSPPPPVAPHIPSLASAHAVDSLCASQELKREFNYLALRYLAAIPGASAHVEALGAALAREHQLPVHCTWDGRRETRSAEELNTEHPSLPADLLLRLVCAGVEGKHQGRTLPWSLLENDAHQKDRRSIAKKARVATHMQEVLAAQAHGRTARSSGVPSFLPSRFTRVLTVQGHRDAIYCSVWDHTGHRFITGSDDALVKIWSADTGYLVATLRGHEAEISDLCVSPDNSLLASGSNDTYVRVWHLDDGTPRCVLAGHTDAVSALTFAPLSCLSHGAPVLISASLDGTVRLWAVASFDSPSPAPLRVLHHSAPHGIGIGVTIVPPAAAARSPSSPSVSLSLPLVQPPSPAPAAVAGAARMSPVLLCAALSSTASLLACGSSDGRLRLWRLREALSFGASSTPVSNNATVAQELAGHSASVTCVAFARHTDALLSGSADGTARLWLPDAHTPRGRRELVLHARATPLDLQRSANTSRRSRLTVTFVCWAGEDRYALCALSDGAIQVWSAASGELLRMLLSHDREAYVLAAHPTDPELLLSASYDGRACLWDVSTAQQLREFALPEGAGGQVRCFLDGHFSPNGHAFALSDSCGAVHLYSSECKERFARVPREQFLATDYAALVRDTHNHVLDAATQLPPHLMARAALCTQTLVPQPDVQVPSFGLPRMSDAWLEQQRLEAEARVQAYLGGGMPVPAFAPPPRARPVVRDVHSSDEAPLSGRSSSGSDDERDSWASAAQGGEEEEEDDDEALANFDDDAPRRTKSVLLRSGRRTRSRFSDAGDMHHSDDSSASDTSQRHVSTRRSTRTRAASQREESSGGGGIGEDAHRAPAETRKGGDDGSNKEKDADEEEGEAPGQAHERNAAPLARWLSGSEAERNTYVPQPHDEVVYLRAGHERFLAAAQLSEQEGTGTTPTVATLGGGGLLDSAYDECAMLVEQVEYVFVTRVHAYTSLPALRVARLSLRPLLPNAPLLTVDYAQVGEADYLVLRSLYRVAVELQRWARGMRVGVYYAGIGLAHGVVEEQLSTGGVWESVLVRWDEDGEVGRVSPWELEASKQESAVLREEGNTHATSLGGMLASASRRGALLSVLANAVGDARFAPFRIAVSTRHFPGYRSAVCAPVDLRLIQARVQSEWYRTPAALLADVERIASNSRAFNGPEHPITAQAEELVTYLTPALLAFLDDSAPVPPPDSSVPLQLVSVDSPPPPPAMRLRLKRRRAREEHDMVSNNGEDEVEEEYTRKSVKVRRGKWRVESEHDPEEPDDDEGEEFGDRESGDSVDSTHDRRVSTRRSLQSVRVSLRQQTRSSSTPTAAAAIIRLRSATLRSHAK